MKKKKSTPLYVPVNYNSTAASEQEQKTHGGTFFLAVKIDKVVEPDPLRY